MKIGIITMHKVLNYGSALQTYALQKKLEELGYDSEIIDYEFPPKKKSKITVRKIINDVIVFLRAMVLGFPQKEKKRRFELFYKKFYHLSRNKYNSETISLDPPIYDVYMTGSDQVWNPRHIDKDANFLLAFAPKGAKKVSFASSFATSQIPETHKDIYNQYLSDYCFISVREPSGLGLVKNFSDKEASVCCDPVFLLGKEQWDKIADASTVNFKEKYILVYAIYYMFDPYPELKEIIDHVQNQLQCKVIFLNGRTEDAFHKNSRVMKSEGPADFIQLIRNAEIVITSSFHGTAFSLIYEKPLMAIVRDNDKEDSRISSLLLRLGDEKSIVVYNRGCSLTKDELYDMKHERCKLDKIISLSVNYLKTSLMNA